MAATSETVLRPDRTLLDSKFEGYRLSLESIAVIDKDLKHGVKKLSPQTDEYGFLHVQLYGLVNSLNKDPWNADTVFFISEKQQINCVQLTQGNYLSEPRVVFSIPDLENQSVISISFPSVDWAVVCNGCGTLYILNTPNRSRGDAWQLYQTHNIDWMETGSVVLASKFRSPGIFGVSDVEQSSDRLDVFVSYIANPQQVKGNVLLPETTVHFVCVIEWLSFNGVKSTNQDSGSDEGIELVSKDDSPAVQTWKLERQRRLISGGVPHYIALDSAGSLLLAAEKEFNFVFDSTEPDGSKNGVAKNESDKDSHDKKEKSEENNPPLYTYLQTSEEVTVVFKLKPETSKEDVKVEISEKELKIDVNEKTVLFGALSSVCNKEESTWTIMDQKLEVILVKAREGEVWNGVVEGDSRGEEVMDPAFIEEIHQKLQHLTSDTFVSDGGHPPNWCGDKVEECDETVPYFTFWRIDGATHRIQQQVSLSGHQWLFNMPCDAEHDLPRLCLRHDVDGLVWQPVLEKKDDSFNLEFRHVATFHAFGYVSASKQDKLACAADSRSYRWAALCDSSRHVYIYRAPEHGGNTELRNRKHGSVTTVAKQHVVSLEECNGIKGMVSSENGVFVLSNNRIYALKIDNLEDTPLA